MSVCAESSVGVGRTSEPVGQVVPGRPCSWLRGAQGLCGGQPMRPGLQTALVEGSGGCQRCSEGVWERSESGGF